ncbi:PREDICTED: uncharacterized protein LOC109588054 [Amphimedon queenslandica]|uniref:Uncharacterized protein n=1 Tax=Amphimedon queenslandica TaxID=400682 RepID=A0AAN0JSG2_AMPQE|nr:PREDICTED: uncharacterized protein LOC109588054 [Amphimedon queenslandica]|eukprot:XP_019859807.1 PREDICTED: uncharacterized protein LOC109588054 [Amphimedon queenslandica]
MSTPAEPDSFSMLPTDTHIQQSLVNDPADIFQSHIIELCDIISSDVVAVCNACVSFELIGPETRSYIMTAKGASDYEKATKLLYDIELQLKSRINKQKYLSNVIEAFLCVNNSNLSIIAEKLKNSFLY